MRHARTITTTLALLASGAATAGRTDDRTAALDRIVAWIKG